ncbi:DUF4145 domain-containing protein [Alteromonas stellipolaris]|uniref:DUF4145 domain-containing protein n=1 Tax=Alteromonas stellipolaris TaxID=233316 RepID=UPI0012E96BDF|nr:DUF4145 domain-containing protein [Alteromonas stellipolaris]
MANTKSEPEFSLNEVLDCFDALHFSRPNISRLKKKIKSSKDIVKGKSTDTYKLHAKAISRFESEIPELKVESEEIVSDDLIVPVSLYSSTRGYIESLSKQINASYENNIFDGCAVLMRRLLEILLIQSYENLSIESEIQDSGGHYKMLNHIVANAKVNKKLGLSRNTKEALEEFRIIGNFSAHKIFYNAKRKDISKVATEYRAAIEELLYKSGIKK